MNAAMRCLCDLLGVNPDRLQANQMTTDELIEALDCWVDYDGEIMTQVGEGTGYFYDEVSCV